MWRWLVLRCICSRKCRITWEPGAQFPKGKEKRRCLCGILHQGSREGIRSRLLPWREPCAPTFVYEEWADTQHAWQLKSLSLAHWNPAVQSTAALPSSPSLVVLTCISVSLAYSLSPASSPRPASNSLPSYLFWNSSLAFSLTDSS